MEPRISIVTLGVADMARSVQFYRDGLGFPTKYQDGDGIAHFATKGTLFGVYPLDKLAEDVGPDIKSRPGFSGITLAHNVRKKEEVAQILALAGKVGGKVVKTAQDVFWGGHSGYFADPDGYYWEVAWNPHGKWDADGNLLI